MDVLRTPMILIIDDNREWSRILVSQGRQRIPVEWHVAQNGLEALTFVRAHAPSLRGIILDLKMPLLDGRTLAVLIRHYAPHVPILPITREDVSVFSDLQALGCLKGLSKGPELSLAMVFKHIAMMYTHDMVNAQVPAPMVTQQALAQASCLEEALTAQPYLMDALLDVDLDVRLPIDVHQRAVPVQQAHIYQMSRIIREAQTRTPSKAYARITQILGNILKELPV